MQLVKPSIEHLDITTDPLKAIELAGRTCYKSEDKISEGSAEKFVQMLLDRGHEAMIEHSNFILSVNPGIYDNILKIEDRQFIRMSCDERGNGCLISGNPTALRDFCLRPDISSVLQRALAVELSKHTPILFDDTIRYTDHLSHLDAVAADTLELFEPVGSLSVSEKLKHQVMSYRIVCDRGVTHEIVRHRLFSYAQESTRYCNYKGGVTFIVPPWLYKALEKIKTVEATCNMEYFLEEFGFLPGEAVHWLHAMACAEIKYCIVVNNLGWTPQQARSVLPNSLKTEIVVTGNLQEWIHFFKLRCSPKAHPQMQEVANMILADMKTRVPVIFDDMG